MPSDVKRSTLALVVLALLHTTPMHPYSVQLKLRQWAKDKVVNVRQRAGLYRTIERLLAAGLVEVHATERNEQRPERTVYAITDAGEAVLREWQLDMLATPAEEFPELPAALSLLAVMPMDDTREALERRVVALEAKLAEHRQGMAEGTAIGVPRLFMVEEEYLIAMAEAELAWVRTLVEEIRTKALRWDDVWLEDMADTFARLEAEGGAAP
jgi:DNA-binding PadR family transcriptional regulator